MHRNTLCYFKNDWCLHWNNDPTSFGHIHPTIHQMTAEYHAKFKGCIMIQCIIAMGNITWRNILYLHCCIMATGRYHLWYSYILGHCQKGQMCDFVATADIWIITLCHIGNASVECYNQEWKFWAEVVVVCLRGWRKYKVGIKWVGGRVASKQPHDTWQEEAPGGVKRRCIGGPHAIGATSSLSGVMNYLEARGSMAKAIQCGILHKLPALNELKSESPLHYGHVSNRNSMMSQPRRKSNCTAEKVSVYILLQ